MRLGFIGCGNMGEAILSGVVKNGLEDAAHIGIYEPNGERAAFLREQYNVNACDSCEALVKGADMLFLCVKPNRMQGVLSEVSRHMSADTAVVSIAAGWPLAKLLGALPPGAHVMRIMPNTPLLAACGVTAIEAGHTLTDNDRDFVKGVFSALGLCVELPCALMDSVTGLSGSGPAFVYMFIDALKQAGILHGLTARDALILAAQTVKGSAQMVLDTQKHPAELADMVCSPGGTTIEGVVSLQQSGFAGCVIDAVDAAVRKAGEMT